MVISSDKFIENAALVAEKLNVSPMIIGITLVALGTSAPEMVVSAIAAFDNAPEIAVGNVLGSNIANIALVFGITLLFSSIPIAKGLSTKEVPLVLAITALTGFLLYDQNLSAWDGIILIIAFIIILSLLLSGNKDLASEIEDELPDDNGSSIGKSLVIAIIGLAVLIGSSKLLVWGAIGIATALGVSELVIGLTIVAIGTSLPELAASVSSVRKGHHDIAIGNILGSNIFNLATVLPLPALIALFRNVAFVTPGISTGYWNAKNMPACDLSSTSRSNKSLPSKLTVPLSTSYSSLPANTLASVLFPEPFGPIIA